MRVQKLLLLIKVAQSSMFFNKMMKALTKFLASKSSGHCNGGVRCFNKIIKSATKSFLFFLLNKRANLFGLELLKV